MILCTGLPISTSFAGEWFNSLIFHGDIKFITLNGWMIIYIGADYMSHEHHLFCAKILGSTGSFLICAYGFKQHHMIGVTVC